MAGLGHVLQSYWPVPLGGLAGGIFAVLARRYPIGRSILSYLNASTTTRGGVIALGVASIAIWALMSLMVTTVWDTLHAPSGTAAFDNPWALVFADGSLVGVGVSQSRTSVVVTGHYSIAFNQDVANCFLSATMADASNRFPSPAFIDLSPGGDPSTVAADVVDKDGQRVNRAFYVTADCTHARPSALVRADGSVAGAFGVNSIRKMGVGTYEVDVTQSVTLCEYNATAYIPTGADPHPVVISLNRRGPHVVTIDVVNISGAHVDSGFFVSLACSPSGHWGYIWDDGTTGRGTGFGSQGVDHPYTGEYEVTFDRPVNSCAYTANTTTWDDPKIPPAIIFVSIGAADSVLVDVTDGAGVHVDRSFFLNVTCQSPSG